MKKFFFGFIIMLILGGLAFFSGWAQFAVSPGAVGVMRSRTHGLDPLPVREGEFRWVWYKLIPTNVTITVFRLNERRHSVSIKNTLPSAEVYKGFTASGADFSYEFSASLSYTIDEASLVSLVEKHSINSQDELEAFEERLSGEIGIFIQGLLESDSGYADDVEKILGSGKNERLERDIRKAFPYIKNVSCPIHTAVFPDFALYRQARGLYEEYLAKQREYLSSILNQDAENRIDTRFRFDELEKYGELLTKYPVLIQFLSIEKGIAVPVTPP
ncbi:MAG: hypothetical protein LBG42_00275 [Treponema sp.]|jgi:hypothetical protein|nr:hypothetical protein [Treponema sp.]